MTAVEIAFLFVWSLSVPSITSGSNFFNVTTQCQVYKGLLKRVVAWKVEERKEERALRSQMQEETAWHVQVLFDLMIYLIIIY